MSSFLQSMLQFLASRMMGARAVTNATEWLRNISAGIIDAINDTGPITTIYNSFLAVGMGILIIYFLVGIYEQMEIKNITAEHLVNHAVRLLLAYLLMKNALYFMAKLIMFGTEAMDTFIANITASEIQNTTVTTEQAMAALRVYAYGANILEQIAMAIWCIFPYILFIITQLVVYVVAIVRGVELVGRIAFAPLVMPDVFKDGKRSVAIKYLKKFFGVAMQTVAVVAVIWAAQLISVFFLMQNNTIENINREVSEGVASLNDETIRGFFNNAAGVTVKDLSVLAQKVKDPVPMISRTEQNDNAYEQAAITPVYNNPESDPQNGIDPMWYVYYEDKTEKTANKWEDIPEEIRANAGYVETNNQAGPTEDTNSEQYKYRQEYNAVLDMGRKVFKQLFKFTNILVTVAAQASCLLILARSKSLAEDLVGA